MKTLVVTALIAIGLIAGCMSPVGRTKGPVARPSHPDFSGKWTLDAAQIAGPGGNGPAWEPWAQPSLGSAFTATQDSDVLTVKDETEQTWVFRLDGSVNRNVTRRGDPTVSRATWEGSKLMIQLRLGLNMDDESLPQNNLVRVLWFDPVGRLVAQTRNGVEPTYITVYKRAS